MTRVGLGPYAALICIGAAWGLTQPLSKMAVTAGHRDVGIIFWQFALGAVALGAFSLLRGRGLPGKPKHLLVYVLIALVGTLLPNWASYTAAIHLPSGILSIIIAMVPMMAFPVAMAFGLDRFSWARLGGLALGFGAILMIALPETSLPGPGLVIWVLVAMIGPAFYAFEGNSVAKWGTAGLDAVQVLWGASVIGLIIAGPLAVARGEWIDPRPPWGIGELAIVLGAFAHAVAYAGYVWMVGRAGPVFATQVSYIVAGFGVVWAMILLGESYSGWVWAALLVMFAGLFLVQPRPGTAAPQGIAPEPPLAR